MSTFFLILLLVLGVIVGNILWLRPGPLERAIAAQREQARQAGLGVLLRPAPDWLALPPGQRLVAHYTLPLATRESGRGRWRWHEGLGNWQPVGHPEDWLQAAPWPTPAPPGWLGLDVRADAVTLYWREDGDPASLQRITSTLQRLAA